MTTQTQEQRSAGTKTKILEAVIESLIENGYAGTSTVDVCRRAGVSRGAQLHHYPSKAALMAAAVERLFSKRHEQFRRTLARLPDSPGRVREALEALWGIYSGGTLAAWLELVAASRTDEDLRAAVVAVNDRFVGAAESTFKRLFPRVDGRRARPFARLLLSTLDGLAMNRSLTGDDLLAEEVLDQLDTLIRPWSLP